MTRLTESLSRVLKIDPIQISTRLGLGLGLAWAYYLRLLAVQNNQMGHDVPIIIRGLNQWWKDPPTAPYGLIWYLVNSPIPHSSAQTWMLWIASLDLGFSLLILVWKGWQYALVYLPLSLFSFNDAPYNLSIMWLTGLGFINPVLLIIPILAKFPFGAPLADWNFILHGSVTWWSNWFFYGCLITWWLTVAYSKVLYPVLARFRYATRQLRERFLGGLNPHARPGGNKNSNGTF